MEEHILRLRRAQEIKVIDKTRAKAAAIPFRDDELLSGRPSCSAADFKTPRLRRCPLDPATINWNLSSRIDGGLDGYVWKVWFGAEGPYALKVFWDAELPEFYHYYAVQRECQNAALLQMVEAAVQQAAEATPILVNANPKTKGDALANLYAFSDEGRQSASSAGESEVMAISSLPRIRKCHGWMKLSGQVFRGLPRKLWAPTLYLSKVRRSISTNKEYTAIVYEYVEEGENPPDVVEEVDKFFWLVGFGYNSSPAARNWKSGVLVDLSDIVHAGGFGWHPKRYGPREAEMLLLS